MVVGVALVEQEAAAYISGWPPTVARRPPSEAVAAAVPIEEAGDEEFAPLFTFFEFGIDVVEQIVVVFYGDI